jgi:hypothetical protein
MLLCEYGVDAIRIVKCKIVFQQQSLSLCNCSIVSMTEIIGKSLVLYWKEMQLAPQYLTRNNLTKVIVNSSRYRLQSSQLFTVTHTDGNHHSDDLLFEQHMKDTNITNTHMQLSQQLAVTALCASVNLLSPIRAFPPHILKLIFSPVFLCGTTSTEKLKMSLHRQHK